MVLGHPAYRSIHQVRNVFDLKIPIRETAPGEGGMCLSHAREGRHLATLGWMSILKCPSESMYSPSLRSITPLSLGNPPKDHPNAYAFPCAGVL
jgi:hypothetical protein